MKGCVPLSHTKNKNRAEGEDGFNSLSLLAQDVDLNDVVEREDSEGVFVSGHSNTMAEVHFKNMLLSPRRFVSAVILVVFKNSYIIQSFNLYQCVCVCVCV